jgi:class 3 adenylate cyclase
MPSLFRLPLRTLLLIAASVSIVLAALNLTPPFRQLEAWAVDLRLRWLAPQSSASDDVVLISIDEKVLASLPYRSPIDRRFVADLVSAVRDANPRAIAVDLLFDQPTEPIKDQRLRETLKQAGPPLIVAWAGRSDGLTLAQTGYLEAFTDGILRGRVDLQADFFDGRVRQVAGRAASGEIGFSGAVYAVVTGKIPPADPFFLAPVRGEGQTAFRTLPARLVVGDGQAVRPWLEDRIVLIGSMLPAEDRHAVALWTADGALPGVEIHAHILARLLDGWQPEPMPAASKPIMLLAAALISVFLVGLSVSGALRAALSAGVVGTAVVTALLLAQQEVMVPVVGPVQTALVAVAATRLRIATVDRERRRFLQRAFGKYISPRVVDRLLAHPEELRLSGERRTITALFTDLEGFTALTESVDPKVMLTLLNAYLDGICRIVVHHGGIIDKLVGDAVVALFNAPVDLENYPCRAVHCALAIDAFASEFSRAEGQRLGGVVGTTRIGIATGVVTVGNFGGDVLFNYTAHGPAMNLASRLENANRKLGTTICVDEATALACRDLCFRSLGTVTAKGFAAPVPIFTPAILTLQETRRENSDVPYAELMA